MALARTITHALTGFLNVIDIRCHFTQKAGINVA